MATVYIAHASISEKGTVNGTKGDSTGKEVCKRTWYSKPWDWIAIFPDEDVREDIASAGEDAAANDNVGYGQSNRNTLNDEAKKVSYKIAKIVTKCNCDCSSLVNVAVVAAGKGTYGSNGWTTSTLKAKLKALGAVIITDSTYLTSSAYCVRGAIYCKEGSHTVIGLTNGSSYKKTLSKAGISTSSSTTASTSSSSAPSYTVGKTYTLQTEVNVRKGAGTSYGLVGYSNLTSDGKKHDTDKDGALDKGTVVTCKKVTKKSNGDIWIKCPSGWLAAYYSGKTYIK